MIKYLEDEYNAVKQTFLRTFSDVKSQHFQTGVLNSDLPADFVLHVFELELCFMLVKLMYSKTFVIQVYNKKQFAAMAEKKILGNFPTVKIKVLSSYPNIFLRT